MELQIKDNPFLKRDVNSKAIIVNDPVGLNRAKATKESFVKMRKKSEEMEKEISTLKSQFHALSELVKTSLGRGIAA